MSYERLTSRNDFQGQCSHCRYIPALDEYGCWNDTEKRFMLCNKCENKERYDKLKDIEDEIENGTLLHKICKEGDEVYIIAKQGLDIYSAEKVMIVDFWYSKQDKCLYAIDNDEALHREVYATEQAAESKIKELKGEI